MAIKKIKELGDSLNWRGSVPASEFKARAVDGKIWLHYRVIFIRKDFTEFTMQCSVGLDPDDRSDTVAFKLSQNMSRNPGYFSAEWDESSINYWLPTGSTMAGHRIRGGLYPDGKLISVGEEVKVLQGPTEATSLFVSVSRRIKSRRSAKRK